MKHEALTLAAQSMALVVCLAALCFLLPDAHTQAPRPRIAAADFANGSKTGGINEATRALPVTGGIIEAPCGELDISDTIVIGNGTLTAKSTIDSISLVGCGSGRGDDVAKPSAGATTLKWTGAPGGVVLRVAGPVGNVGIFDVQIDGNYAGDVGLDIVHSYLSSYKRLSIIHTRVVGLRTQAVDYKFPAMVTGNNNNIFESVVVSAIAGGTAAQVGQAMPNTQSIFDSASNTFLNCSFLGGGGTGIELRLADNNSFYQTVMFASGAALKLTGVAGLPASNYFYPGIVIGPIVTTGTVNSPNFMLPLADTDTPHDPGGFGNFLVGFNAQGQFFGKWAPIPTR